MDLIIRNAKLHKETELKDIYIKDGKFVEIKNKINLKSKNEIDAFGNLLSSPFIDPHLHLDAVLSVGDPRYNSSGTLLEGIKIWGERKPNLTIDIIKKNAREAVMWELANGVQFIRTHADTSDSRLLTVEALLDIKNEMKDLVDIQIVAFPQDGIYTFSDGDKLMRRAMEMGCDVVGGIPHNELTREDGVASVVFTYDLADKYNALIDIHCDETGDSQSRFVEVMAKESILRKYGNRATASHTTSMHNFNNDYAFKMMGIFKRAALNFITNPFDNSVLQNRTDGYPRWRGHTRVDELSNNSINVCIGHDSIMDPWYPMGKGSMLQAANLLMHTAHMSGYSQIESLFEMITDNSAIAMNISSQYGILEGKPANCIILDCNNVFDAIRLTSECLYVIRAGKIVCKTTPAKREVFFNNKVSVVDFKI